MSPRGSIRRAGLGAVSVALAALISSCACAPLNPGSSGSTPTSVYPGSTSTTEVDDSTTTTTDPDAPTTTITDPDGSTTTTTPPSDTGPTTVAELSVDDCIVPVDDDLFVDDVEVVDCDDPHDHEVVGIYEIDDAPEDYPGNYELVRAAYERCQSYFEDYVGIDFWESELDLTTITPSPSTWVDGDRQVVCLVVDIDGNQLVGSHKDARR